MVSSYRRHQQQQRRRCIGDCWLRAPEKRHTEDCSQLLPLTHTLTSTGIYCADAICGFAEHLSNLPLCDPVRYGEARSLLCFRPVCVFHFPCRWHAPVSPLSGLLEGADAFSTPFLSLSLSLLHPSELSVKQRGETRTEALLVTVYSFWLTGTRYWQLNAVPWRFSASGENRGVCNNGALDPPIVQQILQLKV